MLSSCKSSQSLARTAIQLVFVRGQKASTAKLPIVLLQDIGKLGEKGQQVDVAHGFARNCLYPRSQAEPVPQKPRDRHKKPSKPAQEGDTPAKQELQAVLDVLTTRPIVMQCSSNADGGLVDQIGADHIAAAVQQQLQIELAPKLINIAEPFTALGQRQAVLHMTLPDGSKPILQVHLTDYGAKK